jgi:hypothetical protein
LTQINQQKTVAETREKVASAAENLLENDDFYAKNQKRFRGSDTTFIFRLRKNGRKKACPFDGNSSERGLSL